MFFFFFGGGGFYICQYKCGRGGRAGNREEPQRGNDVNKQVM